MMRDRGRRCAARALPSPSPHHSTAKDHRHVRYWRRAARGRPDQQCACRSQSEERREIARPKTTEGKARSAQNALKHGLRAQKYVVLPEEDAAEFAELEAALVTELAPVGALQSVLARRVAVAAWRLARADRIEGELFEERRFADGGLGLALIRDGNGTRSFETLLRYRGAAMAEFWRALRTLKALQAEQAAETGPALAAHPWRRTPWRRTPRLPPPGHLSPIVRSRRNPSAAPGADWNTSCPSHRPPAASFTKHQPCGRRTNPTGSARARCAHKRTRRCRTNPSRTCNLHLR
jgi:hypothetical protein